MTFKCSVIHNTHKANGALKKRETDVVLMRKGQNAFLIRLLGSGNGKIDRQLARLNGVTRVEEGMFTTYEFKGGFKTLQRSIQQLGGNFG
ncbi:MAG: hypothetical protein ACOZAO_02240 [Patescibacteria group bacterium]